MINYGNESKPLKIEVSYRNSNIDKTNCIEINNINVYDVNRLAKMKAMAYAGRDKIRDMYDLAFICNNFWDNLSKETKENIRDALMYKGIEQFEYIIATQSDDKIDETEHLSSFLQMCDSAGVLTDDSIPEKDPYDRTEPEKKMHSGMEGCRNDNDMTSKNSCKNPDLDAIMNIQNTDGSIAMQMGFFDEELPKVNKLM